MDEKSLSSIKLERKNGDSESPVALDLGARVRDLRKARKWTMEQAAQKAGLARSTLSKIENGQMSPTFDAVKKLADGLNISVPQLFTPPKSDNVMARMAHTKEDEAKPLVTPTYEHDLLAASLSPKQMLPYRTRVRARNVSEFEGWVRHDGEEFLYVLSGIVTLYTEFYEPIELRRGDCAYYDAVMGHNVVSKSQEDAMILWVTSMV